MSLKPSKEEILLKAQRILKLSERPPNPSFAYRHLEHIHILSQKLLEELLAFDLSTADVGLADPTLHAMEEQLSKRVS